MTYSYRQQSPGYTQHVVEQAEKAMKRLGFKFSDMFVEQPKTEDGERARAYFLKLDQNERAALREQWTPTQKKRGREVLLIPPRDWSEAAQASFVGALTAGSFTVNICAGAESQLRDHDYLLILLGDDHNLDLLGRMGAAARALDVPIMYLWLGLPVDHIVPTLEDKIAECNGSAV